MMERVVHDNVDDGDYGEDGNEGDDYDGENGPAKAFLLTLANMYHF